MNQQSVTQKLSEWLKTEKLEGGVIENPKKEDGDLHCTFISSDNGEPELIFKILSKDSKKDESLHFYISLTNRYLELWTIVDESAILGMCELGNFKNEEELVSKCEKEHEKLLEEIECRSNQIKPSSGSESISEDNDEDEGSYEIKCPVCEALISDEEGGMGECPHLLLFWNSMEGPEFISEEVNELISDEMELEEVLEEEFLEKVRVKVGANVQLLEAESGLNQCLTSTPTIYAIVKLG